MSQIAILSASVREGRKSPRLALFLQRHLEEHRLASTEIIDLAAYDFPIFHERLKNMKDPPAALLDYAKRIKECDGLIIVTPEYNGGYPAALKNAVDALNDEWHRKPVAICTASDGSFGGTQVIMSLQFSLWKLRAWTVTARLPVPKVAEAFDEQGVPADPGPWAKRASAFCAELLWCIEARALMERHD